MKKNPLYERFLKQHLPVLPDFVETNRPRLDPTFKLGPPARGTHDKNLLEFYFQNDVRHIRSDMLSRPEHYTQEQQAIISALWMKQPLPPGTTDRDINEIVLRLLEKTEHRKKREAVIQQAQKKAETKGEEDPTIERILELSKSGTFEEQQSIPKAIKII